LLTNGTDVPPSVLLLDDLDVVETVVEHAADDTPVEDDGLVDTEDVNEVLNPEDVLEVLDADDVEHPLVAPSIVVAEISASTGSGEAASVDARAGLRRRGNSDAASTKVDQGERREAIWQKELREGGTWGLAEGGTQTKGVEKGTQAD